jgi:hypothetical protein
MVRSKARVKELFGELVLIKKNPWYHPRLLKALMSIGRKPKKPKEILATPPPWFMNPSAMPEKVYERARKFSEVSSRTGGRPIEERLKIIQRELATGRKKRPSKAKEPGKRFHELYPTYEELKGKAATPTITATAPTFRE